MNAARICQTDDADRSSLDGHTSLAVFAASIAHEVNQPLAGIVLNTSNCVRLLATEPADIEAARETARLTLLDAERASALITRLRALFVSRRANRESMDLNETAREAIALSLSKIREYRISLQTELSEALPRIEGDRVQLQQVILNLLLNAAEAMSAVNDRPRLLVIRSERDAKHVRLSVRDTGVGFEPEDVGRLFEAFYTTKSAGMGLGLSLSRSIIESHQGRIRAALNPGGGATFSFSIPRKSHGAKSVSDLRTFRRRRASTTNGKPRCPRLADEHYAMEEHT